jgi:DNA-directed RNA polymerase specialized sigma subunit
MNDKPLTAKEYLSQAYRLDQRINSKLEQVEKLRALARHSTASYGGERVSRSRNVTSMEDSIIRLIEAEHTLNREIDRFVDTKREVQQTIDLVADADCRLLLELRYLCMKRWEDIAGEMVVSRSHVFRLHQQALDMVDTVLRTRRMLGHAEA